MKIRLRRVLCIAGAVILAVPVAVAGVGVATFAALPLIASVLPLELSRTTLSDGARKVEMQGMIHIASPEFYRDVGELVARRRAEGWLVFYEGVRDDLGRGNDAFSDVLNSLGGAPNLLADSEAHPYEMLAPALAEGLVLQDNEAIIGRPGPDVRNVDVTLSELLAELPPTPPSGHDRQPDAPFTLTEVRETFDGLPGWVQDRVRAAFQILLATTTSGRYAHAVLPPAITTLREQRVTRAIEDARDRSILVLYGQLHISAISSHLIAADPAWRIVSTAPVKPF